MSSKEELVEVVIHIPKPFLTHLKKQKWFKMYDDLEDFALSSMREAKEKRMIIHIGARELVQKYQEAKSKNPQLTFEKFLEMIS